MAWSVYSSQRLLEREIKPLKHQVSDTIGTLVNHRYFFPQKISTIFGGANTFHYTCSINQCYHIKKSVINYSICSRTWHFLYKQMFRKEQDTTVKHIHWTTRQQVGVWLYGAGHLPDFGILFFSPVSTKKRLSSGLSAIRPLWMDRWKESEWLPRQRDGRRKSKHQGRVEEAEVMFSTTLNHEKTNSTAKEANLILISLKCYTLNTNI